MKLYETRIEEIKLFCNEYFENLVNENEAKLKQLDEDYDDNLKKLPGYRDQAFPSILRLSLSASTMKMRLMT